MWQQGSGALPVDESDVGQRSWSMPLPSSSQHNGPEFEQYSAAATTAANEEEARTAGPARRADDHRCPEMANDATAHAAGGGYAWTNLARQLEAPLPLSMYELEREDTIDWSDDSASSWLSSSPSGEQEATVQETMQGASGGSACGSHATGEQQVPLAPTLSDRKDFTLEEYCKEHMGIQPHEIKPRALQRMLDLTMLFRGACADGTIHCIDAEPGKVASVFGFAKIIVSDVAAFTKRITDMVHSNHTNCWQSIGRPARASLTAPCYELLREVC